MALALAAPVSAKAPITGQVCGNSGCRILGDPGSLYQAVRFEGAFSLVPVPRARPFYRFTFESEDGFRWDVTWVPSAGVMRADDSKATPAIYGNARTAPYWRTLPPSAAAALRSAASGIEPYPAQARWRVPAAEQGGDGSRREAAVALALGAVLFAAFVTARARRSRAPSVLRRLRS